MNDEQIHRLEEYLHAQIPISAAMEVSVRFASTESVVLSAPLEPNINHKSTVFGGSACGVAILSVWSLLNLRLMAEGLDCQLVIQSNYMSYDRPIYGAFSAISSLPDLSAWPAFLRMLMRKKRARIEVQSILTCEEAIVGKLKGSFVAFLREAS
jgi:thioesterase domain-containing protein